MADFAELDWPEGVPFAFADEPGEHDPCYVVMPGGAMLALNHHAAPGVDVARAKWIVAACNAALGHHWLPEYELAPAKSKARTPEAPPRPSGIREVG